MHPAPASIERLVGLIIEYYTAFHIGNWIEYNMVIVPLGAFPYGSVCNIGYSGAVQGAI